MRAFVAGRGEVGGALARVLQKAHDVTCYDVVDGDVPLEELKRASVLNICFPYSDKFLEQVDGYVRHLGPDATVIVHSTVPVGTTRAIDHPNRAHSPVHGVHPQIDVGLLTFTKYVGGITPAVGFAMKRFLAEANINAQMVSSPEASELSKLCCTLQYGLAIMACKGIKELCDKHAVPFDEVYGWNEHYNRGYIMLGRGNVQRPVLMPQPGVIGGHCVIPNAALLESWLCDVLLTANDKFKEETRDPSP